MGIGAGARQLASVLAGLVLVTCSSAVPHAPELGLTGAAPRRLFVRPLAGPDLTAAGALLTAPSPPRQRPVPPDDTCPALADPGFTARCGIAKSADGPLVWLIEARTAGRGLRAEILRPAADHLDVVLEAVDDDGVRFDDIRAAVADVTGDGADEISVSFYRRGVQQILGLDVVGSPGRVVLHRDYVQGSARASAGRLEGWEAVPDGRTGQMVLTHETLTFDGRGWRRTSTSTSSTAVFGQDFADPFVLRAGGRYYGYSTNRGASNVPIITSGDLRSWYSLPDALPQLPSWSTRGRVWAPSVLARPGGYVLYYATREQSSGLQCLSRAFSTSPQGPFVDSSSGPFVCQRDLGGSIDPSPFVDADGRAYLVWKSEDANGREPSRLWSQQLSPDGLSLVGEAVVVLTQDQDWEAPTVEGPALARDGDRVYLFYSAGKWQSSTYAVGYASCLSPLGPCEKARDMPLLRSAADGTGAGGPGGTEVVADEHGGLLLAYHAWVPFDGGYPSGRRMLHLTPLRFEGGRPVLGPGGLGP